MPPHPISLGLAGSGLQAGCFLFSRSPWTEGQEMAPPPRADAKLGTVCAPHPPHSAPTRYLEGTGHPLFLLWQLFKGTESTWREHGVVRPSGQDT